MQTVYQKDSDGRVTCQTMPLYRRLAMEVDRYHRLVASGAKWSDGLLADCRELLWQMDELLPSGSGIDNGAVVNVFESSDRVLVVDVSYQHMNDAGMYDGWTDHRITIRPTFDGIEVRVSGRDRNGVKDYLARVFYDALTALVDWDREGVRLHR